MKYAFIIEARYNVTFFSFTDPIDPIDMFVKEIPNFLEYMINKRRVWRMK